MYFFTWSAVLTSGRAGCGRKIKERGANDNEKKFASMSWLYLISEASALTSPVCLYAACMHEYSYVRRGQGRTEAIK
jgi:hypothetical protein